MQDVLPFKPRYRVYHKVARRFTGDEFDCPIEANAFLAQTVVRVVHSQPYISYTLRRERDHEYTVYGQQSYIRPDNIPEGRYWFPSYYKVHKSCPAAEHCIMDSFGHVVTEEDLSYARKLKYYNEVYVPRYTRYDDRHETDVRLEIFKGDAKKLKTTYGTRREGISGRLEFKTHDWDYRSEVHGWHRIPHCQPERRANEGHVNEYGPEIVRASRRARYALPSSYDDKACGVWDQRKCWKHNSKRRKQWVPK